ncbi:MAG: signal peptide peptidase SppA [Candidatus Yanofskybacteria bacterium CG10_big_fil_rev_8_21_14_0_10_46_23]|uniref:Signal peptide peptidase SppA n=1 Tax=Candidatus Yanofskybacteria bacterium CG10_big_fil_rev_8_21_14_0_10_46_23 TaxID=1975098 RepID=A0A2H0R492_9BACT|nr:MAG: signal peptide peptidase SppA [Candidatus Yanofskybacteria bacterium CG10_big_fil_rev_8_21_14_0_10_46_23]
MNRTVSTKGLLYAFGFVIVALTIATFWYDFYYWNFGASYSDEPLYEEDYDELSYEGCNVAGIAIQGTLQTYGYFDPEAEFGDDIATSEEIAYSIELAEEENGVRAILLEIDSYGGSPVAAQEIEAALGRITKPVVVQIREAGLSAAYWVATAGDIIFASELSDVGSIGVTQSYIDESKLNEKEGYTYNQLSTGKFKDILSPEKPLTSEERQLLERDLQITHDVFVKAVSENRDLDINKVKELADGSSMLGKMALENGLIDRIGGFYEVEEYLKDLIGEEPSVCW